MMKVHNIMYGCFALLLVVTGCDDKPSTPATESAGAPPGTAKAGLARLTNPEAAPAAAPSALPAGGAPQPPAGGEAQASEDKDALGPENFQETLTNRDPFRSFVNVFKPQEKPQVVWQPGKVLMEDYNLDELKLIGIVQGRDVRPFAMFRSPKGVGIAVKRGDFISKSQARVKQILSDRVVLELAEQLEDRTSLADRVIDLHPRAKQTETEAEL